MKMNNRLLFFCLLFCFFLQSLAAQWLVVYKDNKCGVFNVRTKQMEIPIRYDEIHADQSKESFDYFLWLNVEDSTHYAYSNRRTGKLVYITTGELSYFAKDTYLLEEAERIRFLDKNGETVGPVGITNIEWIVSDGPCLAYRGQDCEVMDEEFNILPYSCEEFLKRVEEEEDEKSIFEIIDQEYSDKQNTYGYKNKKTGQVVMEPVCGQSIICVDDQAFITWCDTVDFSDRQYYLFDKYGKQVSDIAYDNYDERSGDGYIIMAQNNSKYLFDLQTGDWLSLPYEIHFIQMPLSLAVISENGKYGLYDIVERCLVEPCQYDRHEVLNAGYVLEKDGKKGLWNWYGKHLLPAEYDEISESSPYIFRKDSLYGIVTYDKSYFIPAQFKEIGLAENYEDIICAFSDTSYHFYRIRHNDISEMDICTYKGKPYPVWQQLSILKDGDQEVLFDCETQQVLYTIKDAHIDYIYYDGRAVPIYYPDGRKDFIETATGRSLIPAGFIWNKASIAGADFIHLFLQAEERELMGVYEPGKEEWLVPPIYTNINPTHFGYWEVKNEEGKWGIWSQFDHTLILPLEYDSMYVLY